MKLRQSSVSYFHKFGACASLFVLTLLQCATTNPVNAQPLVFATFNEREVNEFQGDYGTFSQDPSAATHEYSYTETRGQGGRSLTVDVTRSTDGGFCGMWMHLHNTNTLVPPSFDVAGYSHLSFWVRGETGGETFQILLTDPDSLDGIAYGDVETFLPGPVDAEIWQEVIVPLDPPPFGLNLSQLVGISLLFNTPGTFTVYLDDFSFKTFADETVPETEGPFPLGPDVWILDNFDKGNSNAFGGHFNAFQREPSLAKVTKSFVEFRGDGGKSLEIIAQKDASQGWCGAWIHFFDDVDKNPVYLDTSKYTHLSFWVKGANGGELFQVKFADRRYIELEDSLSIGFVSDYLSSGSVTTEWQQVLIPLASVPGSLNMTAFGGITLDIDTSGTRVVFIDDVALTRSPDAIMPTTPTDTPDNMPIPPRSMWVWNTEDIYVDDPGPRQELFELCEANGITILWTFLPVVPWTLYLQITSPEFESYILPGIEDHVRTFNQEAHARGIQVHALTGG